MHCPIADQSKVALRLYSLSTYQSFPLVQVASDVLPISPLAPLVCPQITPMNADFKFMKVLSCFANRLSSYQAKNGHASALGRESIFAPCGHALSFLIFHEGLSMMNLTTEHIKYTEKRAVRLLAISQGLLG